MRILAIETSAATGSAAVLDDEGLVAEKDFGEGARHGRDLLPTIDALLGGDPASVDLVAVSAGPGSYTGLRVGITFAKTLGVQSGTPVVSVSSLDVIAANVAEERPLCVVVDARLGQVYVARYDVARKKVLNDAVLSPSEAAAGLSREVLVVGDGLVRHRDVFAAVATVVDDETLWRPRAANVSRLGLAKFKEQGTEDADGLVPQYLRRPQAEVRWEKLQSAAGLR